MAHQLTVQSLAIEQWPGLMTVKDYTDGAGRIVYFSDSLLKILDMTMEEAYMASPQEVMPELGDLQARERKIIDTGTPQLEVSREWRGQKWCVYKYLTVDGASKYVTALFMPTSE